MRSLAFFFFLSLFSLTYSQPGPYGGYTIQFKVLDEKSHKTLNPLDDDVEVFYEGQLRNWDSTWNAPIPYNRKTGYYEYKIASTPVGPAIPSRLNFSIRYKGDSMIIHNTAWLREDTLLFRPGVYLNHDLLMHNGKLKGHNGTIIKGQSLYNYRTDSLKHLRNFRIDEAKAKPFGPQLNSGNVGLYHLPSGEEVIFGMAHHRTLEGNQLGKIYSGSYSPYSNQTQERNNGLRLFVRHADTVHRTFYDYEFIDTFLSQVTGSFDLRKSAIDSFFPEKLDWRHHSFISLAILGQCKKLTDGRYLLRTQNRLKNQLFISNNGFSWERIKLLNGAQELNLHYDRKHETLFALNGSQLHFSKDLGKSWQIIEVDLPEKETFHFRDRSLVEVDMINDHELLVLADTRSGGLLYSIDLNSRTVELRMSGLSCCYLHRELFIRSDLLKIIDNRYVIQDYYYLTISDDGGKSWEVISSKCSSIPGAKYFKVYFNGTETVVPSGEKNPINLSRICPESPSILAIKMNEEGQPTAVFRVRGEKQYYLYSAPLTLPQP